MTGTEMVNQSTGELVTIQSAPPMTVEEIIAQRNVITQVLQHVMIDGTHYGKIPGTGDSKSLLKPGADLLLSTFHIATDPIVEDLSGHQEIRYRVKLRGLTSSGALIGTGLGEASSNEEKYRWKRANRREFENTPENMRRIKYTEWNGQEKQTQQIRSNPYDQVNTVLKMAKKRAAVDLVLTALAAAEVFDNIDDTLRRAEAVQRDETINKAAGGPGPAGAPAEPSHDPRRDTANTHVPGSPDEAGDHGKAIEQLKAQADYAGLREVDVFAQFSVTAWNAISPAMVPQVKDWIKGMQP
ncbi:MAG: hypothetical protein ACR2PR_08155 [Pseudohongiellaceae bacterium]